ncbi:MAG: hypothetical protein K1X67_06605 [Fimbriimonadaceae bacterium]|nr:hypothetical protein [Fimbriimonadaceae bacterium]
MILALAFAAFSNSDNVIAISRGGVGDDAFRAWAVEDTFLDSQTPDVNYGRDALLSVGLGKTALIRFGDLDRLVPQGKRVKSARLMLRIEIGKTPALRDISRVLVPWGEGPDRRGFKIKPPVDPKAKPKKDVGPTWAATWKMRRAGEGGIGWQSAGASGNGDAAPISGAAMSVEGDWIAISGLRDTVNQMVSHPTENYGFAIRFDSSLDLTSSDNTVGRPRLDLELEDVPPAAGFDLSVTQIAWNHTGGTWPSNGQDVTWTATIVNQGTQPCPGFTAQWSFKERRLNEEMVTKPLAPGESTTVQVKTSWRTAADPRTTPLTLVLDTGGKDINPRNDGLTTWAQAMPVDVHLAESFGATGKSRGFGSSADTLQSIFRTWNEAVLPQSRFSFAPEGVIDRFRVQATGPIGDGAQVLAPGAFLAANIRPDGLNARTAIFDLSRAVGLPDWSAICSRTNPEPPLVVDGVSVSRGTSDLFPGLMKGGDTRDEILFFNTLSMQYEPWVDPLVDAQPMPASDLYSASDVAYLNKMVGKIGAERRSESPLYPRSILIRAMDAGGRPLVGMTLDFFPVSLSAVGPKAFTAKTNGQGVASLPAQDGGPFGGSDAPWSLGLYLVRTSAHGVTEWTWLKSWQVIEEAARGSALLNLRFALPSSPMDMATNLAKNKIVTDSANSLPAKLVGLVDDNLETVAELELKNDDWLEIDLGRDRPLGEVRMVIPSGGAPWEKFDIYVYATGQRASEARLWTQERDSAWTMLNRRDLDPKEPGFSSVAYRGPLTRARFIRFVARGTGAPAKIAEIRAAPLTFDPAGG